MKKRVNSSSKSYSYKGVRVRFVKKKRKWQVDYTDLAGKRKQPVFSNRQEAEDYITDQVAKEAKYANLEPKLDADITVLELSEHWLDIVRSYAKPRTIQNYEYQLEKYILPRFGKRAIRDVRRADVVGFLSKQKRSGFANNSVLHMKATLSAMFNHAVDEELLPSNPSAGVGRKLKLTVSARHRQEEIKAFDKKQRARFLKAASTVTPGYYDGFFFMTRTGVRPGEARALRWKDVNWDERTIRIQRSAGRTGVGTTKVNHGRTIEVNDSVIAALRELRTARRRETLKKGWKKMPQWVFCSRSGTLLDETNVARAFKRALKKAKLPEHFSPVCLRHTYASQLLQSGTPIQYVSAQLGHASIRLTYDTYGKWLPQSNRAALDTLEIEELQDQSEEKRDLNVIQGSARPAGGGTGQTQRIGKTPVSVHAVCEVSFNDEPITNQLLYQLS